jgi:hypothetical protein
VLTKRLLGVRQDLFGRLLVFGAVLMEETSRHDHSDVVIYALKDGIGCEALASSMDEAKSSVLLMVLTFLMRNPGTEMRQSSRTRWGS